MKDIMTKRQAVEKYGSESCKNHFRKYSKFKNKSIEEALIKTLQQYYVNVEILKKGRSFVYELEGLRISPTVRHDKRWTNGDMKETTRNINRVVASHLDMYGTDCTPRTLLSWLYKFELINSEQLKVFQYGYDNKARAMILEGLIKNKVIEKQQSQLVLDYSYYLNGLKAKLGCCLKRLEKIGSIKLMEHHTGVYVNYKIQETSHEKFSITEESKEESRVEERIPLDSLTYYKLEKAKKAIRDSYKLSHFTIRTYPNSANVRKYHEEVEALYSTNIIEKNKETFTLDYYYKSYEIVIINKEGILQKYLERIEGENNISLLSEEVEIYNLNNRDKFHENLYKDTEKFSLKKEMDNNKFFKGKTEVKKGKETEEYLEMGLFTEESLKELQEENIEKFYRYASKEYYDYSLKGKYHKKIMEIHDFYSKVKDDSSEIYSTHKEIKYSWIFENSIIPLRPS